MKIAIYIIVFISLLSCSKKESDLIIHKMVDKTFTGLFEYEMDFQGDSVIDLRFQSEIVHDFIEGHDTIAIVVHPFNYSELYDDSEHGYIPPLNYGTEISEKADYHHNTCVLATFNDAGRFDGKGFKYVGLRLANDKGFNYGWIQIYISETNDTLKIVDYAYKTKLNSKIFAGDLND